jgi:small subunit ribosomal protein S4
MAVYHDARCRLCRREGMKLFLKGARCFTVKETNYGQQLREKQKARRIYGLLESQFRHFFTKAAVAKGVTGEALLQMLERRLDNVVFRLGFAPSRSAARQLVRHGHVTVNGRRVDIPSLQVKAGDEVSFRDRSRSLAVVQSALEARKGQGVPEWLELSTEGPKGKVLNIPSRESIPVPIREQLIVELYSK